MILQTETYRQLIFFWGGGVIRPCLANIFCKWLFCSYSSSPMVLGPVNFPAEVHNTTVFALRNGKCSRLGVTHPRTRLKFRPWLQSTLN